MAIYREGETTSFIPGTLFIHTLFLSHPLLKSKEGFLASRLPDKAGDWEEGIQAVYQNLKPGKTKGIVI
jgi:hypothetical protein